MPLTHSSVEIDHREASTLDREDAQEGKGGGKSLSSLGSRTRQEMCLMVCCRQKARPVSCYSASELVHFHPSL